MRSTRNSTTPEIGIREDTPVNPRQRAFLAAFSECGTIKEAARCADISRQSHYDWLRSSSDYAVAFAEAENEAGEALEAEARRRAVEGFVEPVVYQGKLCYEIDEATGEKKPIGIRKFSDTLLIFLMKGAIPEKYKDRVESTSTNRHEFSPEAIEL